MAYLAGSVAYVSVPLLIVFAARPSREAFWDMVWPAAQERRLAAAVFWATLLLPALIAPAIGVRVTSLWSMSAWTLLPVMLLSSPLISIAHSVAARVVAVALAFPLVMIIVAPAIGLAVHWKGVAAEGHSSLIAAEIERLWRKTTDRPLRVFGGTDIFAYGVASYLHDRPTAVHVLERPATPQEEMLIEKDGVALLCPMSAPGCIAAANARAAASLPGKRSETSEIEVSRHYLGQKGRSERYLVIAIPPARPRAQ
jgi:hypothetical protein